MRRDGLLRFARNDAERAAPHTTVVLRESGGPSTPRLFGSIIGVSGILGGPVKPGDDSGVYVRDLATRCARGLQVILTPSVVRGRRECRMRAAPAISCATCTKSARMSIQGSGEHPTFPAQWLYGLLRALPGEPCTVATVDANVGASGPHVFAVRFGRARQSQPLASTATRPSS